MLLTCCCWCLVEVMLLVDSRVELESNSLSYRLSLLGCFMTRVTLSLTSSSLSLVMISLSPCPPVLNTWPSRHSSSASLLRNSQLREFTWKQEKSLSNCSDIMTICTFLWRNSCCSHFNSEPGKEETLSCPDPCVLPDSFSLPGSFSRISGWSAWTGRSSVASPAGRSSSPDPAGCLKIIGIRWERKNRYFRPFCI